MDLSLTFVWNSSFNQSLNIARFAPKYGWTHVYLTSAILGFLILCTIIGNVFVVAAIILERNLQSVSNYLILSLAVADLMVASLVMSVSLLSEISKQWFLGIELCDFWICFDVMCCSASILHLVAIAFDRYWAVTNIDYIRMRTAKRIIIMIVLVWFLSLIISIPSRFYASRTWTQVYKKVVINGICDINDEYLYTIFSTVGAFYMPMFLLIGIYLKIYQTARARIRKHGLQKSNHKSDNGIINSIKKCPFRWSKKVTFVQIKKDIKTSHRYQCSSSYSQSKNFVHMKIDIKTYAISSFYNNNNNNNSDSNNNNFSKIPANAFDLDSINQSSFDPNSSSSSQRFCNLSNDQINENNVCENNLKSKSISYPLCNQYLCDHDKKDLHFSILQSPIVPDSDCVDGNVNQSEQMENNVMRNWKDTSSLNNSPRFTSPNLPRKNCIEYLKKTRKKVHNKPTLSPNFLYKLPGLAIPESVNCYNNNPTMTTNFDDIPNHLSKLETISNPYAPSSDFTSRKTFIEQQKQKLEHKRERKAARTLAIITGCFILCWLPFFIQALVLPFCGTQCSSNDIFNSFCLWLGYCNSLLNPIIYTIFSPEFRNAFNKILFGRYQKTKRSY